MTAAGPRVSVVLGVYNKAPYLAAAISSVVAQTMTDWELIIVDDGSTDGTGAITDLAATRDRRIRVIHQPNSGLPAAARNRGLAETRGRVITFLDGDDRYHPEKLRLQVAVLDACPEIGATFHDLKWFSDDVESDTGEAHLASGRYLERARSFLAPQIVGDETVWVGTHDFVKFLSLEGVGIHTSTIAVRREVLAGLEPPSFREDIPHAEDLDLWIRIAWATRLAVLPISLSYYRQTSTGWMATTPQTARRLGDFIVKSTILERLEDALTAAEWPQYRERVATAWWRVAYDCLAAGLVPEARLGFRRALRRHRRLRGKWLAAKGLVASVVPTPIRRAYWRISR